ncbi:peptidase domain-containing ABC transporter [Alteromonas sp. D210916BOD_24]|uniref:peptidase domain-containing ABC transporter n=1 Tax=Alteromonas sp. D210916BOD_24 TaxID=3157618 RepID=UPI00399CE032
MTASSLHHKTGFLRTQRQVPTVLQNEAAECGLACMVMIAQFYGDKRDINTLRQTMSVSLRGATLKDIIDMASHLGFHSRAVKIEMNDLTQLRCPAVLHWNLNHFVVLVKVKKHAVVINDPALGLRTLPLNIVSQHLSGIALEVQPSNEFEPKQVSEQIGLAQFLGGAIGFKRNLITLFTLSFILQLFALASPYYMQTVIDDVLIYNNLPLLQALAIGFAFLLIIECFTNVFRKLLILSVSTRLQLQLSASVFKHLIALPIDYFAKRHIGDVVSRFGSVKSIREFLTTGVVTALLDGVMAITTLLVMGIYSIKLTLVVLAVIAVYLCMRLVILPWTKRLTAEKISLAALEQSHFMESVRAILPVRVYHQEGKRQSDWQNKLVETLNKDIELGKLNIGSATASQLLFGVENLIVIYIGATLVMSNTLTIGMLLAFLAYKTRFVSAIDSVVSQLIELKMLAVHFSRLSDILLTRPIAQTDALIPALPKLSPQENTGEQVALQASNIGYRYSAQGNFVFNDLNLTVKKGDIVAIVGESGCGKSTLIKCLMGLYPLTTGTVKCNGKNAASSLVKIASVLQEDVCFSGTIAQNICCFEDCPKLENIICAAQLACIHSDIIAMPMQYQSLVGDMGSSLSGGQQQRLLLARALYQKPEILFLDEASSHLDMANEAQINAHLQTLNMTRIIVAHRPQSVAIANKVYRLVDGKLLQQSASKFRGAPLNKPSGDIL